MPRPDDFTTVQVTHGALHHLVVDPTLAGGQFEACRTRAGSLWEASQNAPAPGHGIQLGVPGIPMMVRRRRVAS